MLEGVDKSIVIALGTIVSSVLLLTIYCYINYRIHRKWTRSKRISGARLGVTSSEEAGTSHTRTSIKLLSIFQEEERREVGAGHTGHNERLGHEEATQFAHPDRRIPDILGAEEESQLVDLEGTTASQYQEPQHFDTLVSRVTDYASKEDALGAIQSNGELAHNLQVTSLQLPMQAADLGIINTTRASENTLPSAPSSLEARQIASIMQQMDEMRAEIARLRQSSFERSQSFVRIGGVRNTGTTPLPDYTSMDGLSELGGTYGSQVFAQQPTSFTALDVSSEINSTLLPEYATVDGRMCGEGSEDYASDI